MSKHISELAGALVAERGAAVSSADCATIEVAHADACGRLFVYEDGFGFVLRPHSWRDRVDEAARLLEEAYDTLPHGPLSTAIAKLLTQMRGRAPVDKLDPTTCPQCRGKGECGGEQCEQCGGSGWRAAW